MRSDRYVVTELEGYPIRAERSTGNQRPGLSVHVLDRAYNYRQVATWRSEDYRYAMGNAGVMNGDQVREHIRARAHAHAVRLNGS